MNRWRTPSSATANQPDRGYEYKSKTTFLGIPLLHISFKYRPNRMPIPAKGIIAIGQIGLGIINISQVGFGIFSISQFTVSVFAIAQVAFAYSLIAQVGLYIDQGYGQVVKSAVELLDRASPEELEAIEYSPVPGDDWNVSTPAAQGLDPTLIAKLYYDAGKMSRLYGMLVVKNGQLIAEGYFNEGSIDQQALLQSVTKSYTSALVGIALGQGHLMDVDQKMIDFFPELAGQLSDPRKSEITIRHLLQMRSGYPWEETASTLWQGLLSGTYVPLIEEFKLTGDPGTEFNYSNLTSNWLGMIVARACGTDLKPFAEEFLFTPLGAEVGEWKRDRDGNYIGCGEIRSTLRDMAKFGLLYLNDGLIEGEQIVSADWVEVSLRTYSTSASSGGPKSGKIGRYFRNIGYGYQWWSAQVGDYQFNYAAGHGGQLIVLLEEFDMVIAVTSDPFYLQHDGQAWEHEKANFNLVGKFIKALLRSQPSGIGRCL
jgi:CubicO group peptidase (beta-lactamase class C family)